MNGTLHQARTLSAAFSSLRKSALTALALLPAVAVAVAGGPPPGISPELPNLMALGVGSTPAWQGAADHIVGVMPAAHLKIENGYVAEWLGTSLSLDMSDSDSHWHYGPTAVYRFGRGETGIDELDALPSVSSSIELGAHLSWGKMVWSRIPWHYKFSASLTSGLIQDNRGSNATLSTSLWLPLSHSTFFGSGAGLTWSDKHYMQRHFSVTEPGLVAGAGQGQLIPFTAQAGVRQYQAWLTGIHRLDEQWLVIGAVYLQQLRNDAAASPIVSQYGQQQQLTYGIAVGYTF